MSTPPGGPGNPAVACPRRSCHAWQQTTPSSSQASGTPATASCASLATVSSATKAPRCEATSSISPACSATPAPTPTRCTTWRASPSATRGGAHPTLLASLVHLHFGQDPNRARRFVDAARGGIDETAGEVGILAEMEVHQRGEEGGVCSSTSC